MDGLTRELERGVRSVKMTVKYGPNFSVPKMGRKEVSHVVEVEDA